MSADELIKILREHMDASIYVEASWGDLTNNVEAVFQPAKEYCRTKDAVVIKVRGDTEEGGAK